MPGSRPMSQSNIPHSQLKGEQHSRSCTMHCNIYAPLVDSDMLYGSAAQALSYSKLLCNRINRWLYKAGLLERLDILGRRVVHFPPTRRRSAPSFAKSNSKRLHLCMTLCYSIGQCIVATVWKGPIISREKRHSLLGTERPLSAVRLNAKSQNTAEGST